MIVFKTCFPKLSGHKGHLDKCFVLIVFLSRLGNQNLCFVLFFLKFVLLTC